MLLVRAVILYSDCEVTIEKSTRTLCNMLHDAERPSGSSMVNSLIVANISDALPNTIIKHLHNLSIAVHGTKALMLLSASGKPKTLKIIGSSAAKVFIKSLQCCTSTACNDATKFSLIELKQLCSSDPVCGAVEYTHRF
jgi:hypothetical protein